MSDETTDTDAGGIERFEELATGWENEAHHLENQGHDEVAGAINACASELRRVIDTDTDRREESD